MSAGAEQDRITVRDPRGDLVLRIDFGAKGATLELGRPELELRASGKLTLAARDIALRAERDLELSVGRDVRETVAGARHTRVLGADRLEAEAVELQANVDSVRVRAMGAIALDGEHIGLNDDPCPHPFEWSAIARDGSTEARAEQDAPEANRQAHPQDEQRGGTRS
jgi:hypothetical protein